MYYSENHEITEIANEIRDTKRAEVQRTHRERSKDGTPPLEIYAAAAIVNELRRIADAVEKIAENTKTKM